MNLSDCFLPGEVLLPQVKDLEKWSVIACDQFTADPAYWERVSAYVGQEPSTLRLMLPDAWLARPDRPRLEAAIIENPEIPIALHLDHGDTFELCKSCIDGGFTSVMIDASSKSFEENIALTRQVVEYAHDHGVVVEAELGTLAGVEAEVSVEHGNESYTRPDEVEEFVSRTGCDSLAIAIGTSHGAYKFKASQCTRNADGVLVPPPLRFDVLHECIKRLPGFPIVLHGSSSVPQEFVKMVNEYGGNMPDAIGIPEDQLREAAKLAVCKINIDSDIRLAMTANIRKYFAEHPDHFDPRQYLKPARQAVKDMVAHKIIHVLGSDGKA